MSRVCRRPTEQDWATLDDVEIRMQVVEARTFRLEGGGIQSSGDSAAQH